MPRLTMLLIGCLLPACGLAASLELRGKTPAPHVVEKGDTLWAISGTFLNSPWKWPDVWQINKDTIKDPHWIYPGQTILFGPQAPAAPTPPAPAKPVTMGPGPAKPVIMRPAVIPAPPARPPLIVQPMPLPAISAHVVSIYGGESQGGQRTIVIIDKGSRQGMENGLILVLHRGEKPAGGQRKAPALSDAGYGQLQVFRTFDRTAYATVTQASAAPKLLDFASTQ